MTRAPDAGFTLIETLVALAVLATGAVALMGVVEDHARRIGALEDRIAMRWVAENRLAARHLGLSPERRWESALGTGFAVGESQRALGEDGLTEVIVQVSGDRGGVVMRGYVAQPTGQQK